MTIAKKDDPAPHDSGQAQLQAQADEVSAKGYQGTVPDQPPNEHYTLGGVRAPKTNPKKELPDG